MRKMKELIKSIPLLGIFSVFIWKKIKRHQRKREEKLFRALISNTHPLRLVVGSSNVFQSGWVSSNIEYLNILKLNDWQRYFTKESLHAIMAEHVWEHLSLEDGAQAAKNCYKYLIKGGYIRVAVPDGFHPDPQYIEEQKVGGKYKGEDGHKVLYNYKTLSLIFKNAGFKVKLLEYFNDNNEFCYNEWSINDGLINRSLKFDKRNINQKPNYTSIIIDAVKE